MFQISMLCVYTTYKIERYIIYKACLKLVFGEIYYNNNSTSFLLLEIHYIWLFSLEYVC